MNAARRLTRLVVVILVLAAASGFVWFVGASNPHTQAGYVGYVYQKAIFGRSRFIELQLGPTSPGRHWMYDVVNVSITPYTYTEDFTGDNSVLAKDDLKVSYRAHVIWKVKADAVKEFVEQYSTLGNNKEPDVVVQTAFANFMKEPLRTYARAEVQKHNGLEIKQKIDEIGDEILQRAQARASGTPFDITDVVVGNIQYPSVVADAVADKLKATQDLERMATEVKIEEKKKEKRVVEAGGITEAMKIITDSLTPQYLQYLAIEAQKGMVNSPNHTTIYIPSGPMGVPLVGTFDVTGKEGAKRERKGE
jgi:regulator of protease activity HflC (stomatin/prohibitin superfamily)